MVDQDHRSRRTLGRRARRGAPLWAIALLACSCQRAPASPPPSPIAIDLFGCTEVDRAHACWVSAPRQRVRFWHPSRTATITVALDARTTTVARSKTDDGTLIEVELPFPPPARLIANIEDGEVRARGEVPLVRYDPVPDLVEANRIRRDGGAARAEILTVPYLGAEDPVVRSAALGIAGRLALARGEYGTALELLREAIAMDERLGLRSREILDRDTKAHVETHLTHDYVAAVATLASTTTLADGYDEGRVRLAGTLASLKLAIADYRGVLREIHSARRIAERVNFLGPVAELEFLQRECFALRAMGRLNELAALLPKTMALESRIALCLRPQLLETAARMAWDAQRGGARLPPDFPSIRALFQQVERMRRVDCPGPDHALALANLSEFDAEQGNPNEALRTGRAALQEVNANSIGGVRAALAIGKAQLALRRPVEALEAFAEAERMNERLVRRVEGWGLRLSHGQALEALGRTREAIALYEDGEEAIEAEAPLLPLGEGQASFAELRRASSDRLITLHLQQGRAELAFQVARRRHTRTLGLLARSAKLAALDGAEAARWQRALARYRVEREALEREASDDWKLAAAQLQIRQRQRQGRVSRLLEELDEVLLGGPRVRPSSELHVPAGAVALAYYRLNEESVAFGWASTGLRWSRGRAIAPETTPEALARRLLEPFRAELLRAKQVVVLAEEGLETVDLSALPFEGAPLVARAPITHSLDLGQATRPEETGHQALVVGDPRGDLPNARSEAAHVAQALQQSGLEVLRLDGSLATHSAIAAALADARTSFAHYAGHARFAGLDGQSSGLLLAGEATLLVTDVLSAQRVPSRLVLSGCETARSTGGPAEGLGIAQAFLLAGASEVIAARRAVDDATTAQLMRALYAGDPGESLSQALRRAQLEVFRAQRGTAWSAFRILVR